MTGRACANGATAALAILLALGCTRTQPQPLRIGLNAWPGYEFLGLAAQKGFFADEGLQVRIIEYNSLSDERRAFERGQIDVLASTVVEVLQSRSLSKRQARIVYVVDASDGADVIVARSTIASPADLRDKRVGLEVASLGSFMLGRALEKHGLDLGQVGQLSQDQTSLKAALEKGEVDAVVTYPPVSLQLASDARFHTVFSTKEIPGEVIDVIAVADELVGHRPDDIARLIKGFQRALAFSRQSPAEAYALMGAREGISAKAFEDALTDGIHLFSLSEQQDYFAGGKLDRVVKDVDRIMRKVKQVEGVDRSSGVAAAVAIERLVPR